MHYVQPDLLLLLKKQS